MGRPCPAPSDLGAPVDGLHLPATHSFVRDHSGSVRNKSHLPFVQKAPFAEQ